MIYYSTNIHFLTKKQGQSKPYFFVSDVKRLLRGYRGRILNLQSGDLVSLERGSYESLECLFFCLLPHSNFQDKQLNQQYRLCLDVKDKYLHK